MENLKKQLQEKGYTFFNMQDYPEFKDEYEYYKKYICSSENNLLKYINSVRFDSESLKLNINCETFQEVEEKINQEYYLKTTKYDKSHSQYWFYGEPVHITNSFRPLINKIVNIFYNENSEEYKHILSITYYKPECFLKPHRDGQTGTRLCAVLIYLNDEEYKPEWGGNIVFEGTETVPPIYGNIAVLDFKEGNCLHEVKKVIDGYGRYAILDFISSEDVGNTPNHY